MACVVRFAYVYNRYMTQTITTTEMTLEEKLKAIEEAMLEANGDVKKEQSLMNALIDPQDSLNCEGCQ